MGGYPIIRVIFRARARARARARVINQLLILLFPIPHPPPPSWLVQPVTLTSTQINSIPN